MWLPPHYTFMRTVMTQWVQCHWYSTVVKSLFIKLLLWNSLTTYLESFDMSLSLGCCYEYFLCLCVIGPPEAQWWRLGTSTDTLLVFCVPTVASTWSRKATSLWKDSFIVRRTPVFAWRLWMVMTWSLFTPQVKSWHKQEQRNST